MRMFEPSSLADSSPKQNQSLVPLLRLDSGGPASSFTLDFDADIFAAFCSQFSCNFVSFSGQKSVRLLTKRLRVFK